MQPMRSFGDLFISIGVAAIVHTVLIALLVIGGRRDGADHEWNAVRSSMGGIDVIPGAAMAPPTATTGF
ncbi:MAG: hypothetical protein ACT443_01605 [Gemmatimonadota bacterium]